MHSAHSNPGTDATLSAPDRPLVTITLALAQRLVARFWPEAFGAALAVFVLMGGCAPT